jgi:VIT1/CCC1 family predicted Fe2+/Mn2+ transporter
MVLGANDGIVSTAALLLGVAAADSGRDAILTAGIAGLVAGAISMALGEFVSVASQRDSERSDIAKETLELETQHEHELEELVGIYQARGLSRGLAEQVAAELTAHDALGTHLRDELGISQDELARPLQAAGSSAAAFAVGAGIPLVAAAVAGDGIRMVAIVVVSILSLAVLGYTGARLGGAPAPRPMARVLLGGIAAMAATIVVGNLFGAVLG